MSFKFDSSRMSWRYEKSGVAGLVFLAWTLITTLGCGVVSDLFCVLTRARGEETNNLLLIHHEMRYPRVMDGPSFCLLLHAFSMIPLAHAGLMHLFLPHSSKVGRPHIGPLKRASADNTTVWVIQDTYEGPSFFECVNIYFSIDVPC